MPVVDPAEEPAVGDVVVQDVGDLELAAARWREGVDDGEGVRPQEVDPDRDQVALRLGRLLLEADDVARGVELGDPEPLRVRDAVEERARAPRAVLELAAPCREGRAAQDVVAEDAAERVVADEVAGEPDRVGDPRAPRW